MTTVHEHVHEHEHVLCWFLSVATLHSRVALVCLFPVVFRTHSTLVRDVERDAVVVRPDPGAGPHPGLSQTSSQHLDQMLLY